MPRYIDAQNQKLKPCPFCGHNAVLLGKRVFRVACGFYLCEAMTRKYPQAWMAKEAWNRRSNGNEQIH